MNTPTYELRSPKQPKARVCLPKIDTRSTKLKSGQAKPITANQLAKLGDSVRKALNEKKAK